MSFFTNTKETPSIEQELKRSRKTTRRDVIICVIILLGFIFYRESTDSGTISPVLNETTFGIVGMDGVQHDFTYADVDTIEIFDNLEEFDRGTQIDGSENKRCCSGTFKNEAYGEYQFHVLTKLDKYIVIHDGNGVLVFNVESDETTQSVYDYLVNDLNVGQQLAN